MLFFMCFSLLSVESFAQINREDKLALQYLENGEFDKAEQLYEKLFDKNSSAYYSAYIKCVLGMKNYQKGEKIIKKQNT